MKTGVTVSEQIEHIIPSVVQAKAMTQNEIIKLYSKQLENGEATIYDIGKQLKLTNKQIDFAKYYVSEEFYGNGIAAYGKAYSIDYTDKNQRNRCSAGASASLKHHTIMLLINILLDANGFNDEFINKQIMFLATQSSDLKAKALGIKLYNDVTGRVKKQVEINHTKTYDFSQLKPDELQALIAIADRAKLQND